MQRIERSIDVSEAAGLGEEIELAVTIFLPDPEALPRPGGQPLRPGVPQGTPDPRSRPGIALDRGVLPRRPDPGDGGPR